MEKTVLKNLLAFILLSLLLTDYCLGQSPVTFKERSFYAEGFGAGGTFSLNYERIYKQNSKTALFGRIGWNPPIGSLGLGIPIEVGFFRGKKKHHLEYSVGIAAATDFEDPITFLLISARIGYRFQKPEGGFVLRAGVGPGLVRSFGIVFDQPFTIFPIIPGLALGYNLKNSK